MLKYPSILKPRGKETKILISDKKLTTNWYGKIKVNALARFFKSKKSTDQHSVLKLKEFVHIGICWQLPLLYCVYYIDAALYYGGATTFFASIMFAFVFAIPLLMLLLFLGCYAKCGYIKLWEMFPILKGAAWAVSIYSVFLEFFNISIAGLALLYLMNIFNTEVHWSNCNFEGASNKCYPMYPTQTYTKKCCNWNLFNNCTKEDWDNILHYPSFDYYMNHMLNAPDRHDTLSGMGTIRSAWVGSVCLTWFLIFCLMTLGFQRYHELISTITTVILAVFGIIIIGILVFLSPHFGQPDFGSAITVPSILRSDFWIPITVLSLFTQVPGNFVLLGAMGPPNMLPTTDVFTIYGLKFLALSLIMICISLILQIIQMHYKVVDLACIPITGLILIFAAIPDILVRLPASHLYMAFWFLSIWCMGFFSSLYTMSALLESIIEAVPGIAAIRIYFCITFCTVCFFLNITILTDYYFNIFGVFRMTVVILTTILLLIIFSIGIYGYSIPKIATDFYFTYGKPLGSYWTNTLKLMCLSAVGIFYTVLANVNTIKYINFYVKPNLTTLVLCYSIVGLIFSPIVFVAIGVYLQYKNNHQIKMAVLPTANWGPPTNVMKDFRRKFNPQRELQYCSEDQMCKHNCLVNSEKLMGEMELMKLNRKLLMEAADIIEE